MYAVFWLTFTLGEYPMDWTRAAASGARSRLSGMWPGRPQCWLRSLLVDGVIGGVGGVVVFLPNILLLFLAIALLEDTGYMARAAFVMDRLMHKIGLHGKSFIPHADRLRLLGAGDHGHAHAGEPTRPAGDHAMVLPLMSCGARLPIYSLLIPAFFPPRLARAGAVARST